MKWNTAKKHLHIVDVEKLKSVTRVTGRDIADIIEDAKDFLSFEEILEIEADLRASIGF